MEDILEIYLEKYHGTNNDKFILETGNIGIKTVILKFKEYTGEIAEKNDKEENVEALLAGNFFLYHCAHQPFII